MNASEKEDTEIDATKILSNSENAKLKKKKKKKVALNDADKCGVCYLSRIPPHMDHVKLRHILSQFGDIQRIFLALQGGKKRSSFYYDLWNIKYLSKFKWDDLTEELALKKATREQKLAVELSAAKRERDFYLSKVDQSRALNAIEERLKKKPKVQQESFQVAKVVRHFPQTKPIAADNKQNKTELSDDILDAVCINIII
uniref:Pre-rRNA-processing protein esf2 n=1 Tax=Cajanus cajan TaxID=3821 RepID=A0A151RQ99_CAJCA|nr:Pre-rRNA-processing protein esf2 [Cajanus cajan]